VRALEFFAAHISNPNTREAYGRAVSDFCTWLEARGLVSITDLQTLHVAAFIRELTAAHSTPTVKQRLAAIRAFAAGARRGECWQWIFSGLWPQRGSM
jgi:site-specific recombinase XerD